MAQTPIYIDERGRRRRDDRAKDESQSRMAQLEAKLEAALTRLEALSAKIDRVDEDLQCFELTGDSGIDCDGIGPKDIVVRGSATSASGAASGKEWFQLTLCDDTTLEVWARNVTPP